jgi:hypothetical protein
MPALFPVKKERVGLGSSRMGTKENKIAKAGRPCSWECHEKELKHTVIQKYVFLEIIIDVKASRVYHGRRVGQAWCICLFTDCVHLCFPSDSQIIRQNLFPNIFSIISLF